MIQQSLALDEKPQTACHPEQDHRRPVTVEQGFHHRERRGRRGRNGMEIPIQAPEPSLSFSDSALSALSVVKSPG